jgi:hypothetical protein
VPLISIVSPRPTVSESIGVGVATAIGVEAGTGALPGTAEVFEIGDGGVTTFTPFLHTNFFPDLTHEYFNPPTITVAPSFLQAEPFVIAAWEGEVSPVKARRATINLTMATRFRLASINFSLFKNGYSPLTPLTLPVVSKT